MNTEEVRGQLICCVSLLIAPCSIGELEGRNHISVLQLGPPDFFIQVGGQDAHEKAIEVVYCCGEEEQGYNGPAKVGLFFSHLSFLLHQERYQIFLILASPNI